MKAPEQAQKDTSPRKINVTSKSPVGDISVVTLIRTDTTLDHSQKAEKVCSVGNVGSRHIVIRHPAVLIGLCLRSELVLGASMCCQRLLPVNAPHIARKADIKILCVGGSSQADRLKRNYAMDDSIGGS